MRIMLIALAKISDREGSISPPNFYGQLSDYKSHMSRCNQDSQDVIAYF